MTRKISLIFFSFITALSVQSQCQIDSLSIEVSDCIDGQTDIWLNFQYQGTESDQFSVKGNGIDYGNYSYQDLPVNIGPITGDPELFYEFVVRDLRNDSCTAFIDYGYVSCGDSACRIRNLTVFSQDSCVVDGSYTVQIDFESQEITHVDIFVDGDFLKFASVNDLPLQVSIPNHGEQHNVIKVSANDQEGCFVINEVLAPLCTGECGISNLQSKVIECNGNQFYIKLNLDHFGPHSKHFTVRGNGAEYGLFPYSDLPVVIGPFESGAKEAYEFIVKDSIYSDCMLELVIDGTPCQEECNIGPLKTEIIECDSGTFNLLLNFEYSGALSDSFKVKGNGIFYGQFAYADLPITLVGLSADGITPYEFVAIDQEGACRNFVELGTVDCYCLWSDIVLDPGDCTSDSTYGLVINFTPGNVDSFSLYSEGVQLGIYPVTVLPLRLEDFPATGAASDELWICALMTNCCVRFEVESPECVRKDCSVTNLKASTLECQEGQYKVQLDFDYQQNTSDYFIVKSNGEFLGEYRYKDLPVKVGPFWSVDSSVLVLSVCDAINHDCHGEVEIFDPGCGYCNIGDLKVEVGECTSDSTYRIILNAEVKGAFDFYVNGHFCGTFESDQLPLTFDDFPASGELYDYIKICSLDSNYCCSERKIESPVCARRNSCAFENVRFELTECTPNNVFYAYIFLDTVGSPDGTFIIQRENQLLEFSYQSLPVKIGPFEGGETFYQFEIYDANNSSCKKELTFGRVVCEEQCDLNLGKVEIVECDEDQVIILIDSLQGSYQAFDIYFGDQYLGFHKSTELPLRLKASTAEMNDDVLIRICVSDNTTCCQETVLQLPDCKMADQCLISDLRVDTVECVNDSFYVNIDFNSNLLDSSYYLLKINGELYREFQIQDLPLHVGPLPSGSDKEYSFVVRSRLYEGCVAELHLDGLECPAAAVESDVRLLVLASSGFTNYVRVPDFISQRSIFQLVDLSGRILYEMEFSVDTRRALIELPVTVAGMYLVKINSRDGQQHLSKIIIP